MDSSVFGLNIVASTIGISSLFCRYPSSAWSNILKLLFCCFFFFIFCFTCNFVRVLGCSLGNFGCGLACGLGCLFGVFCIYVSFFDTISICCLFSWYCCLLFFWYVFTLLNSLKRDFTVIISNEINKTATQIIPAPILPNAFIIPPPNIPPSKPPLENAPSW